MTHTWAFFFVNFSGVNRQVTSIWVFDKVTWKKLELMKHTISSKAGLSFSYRLCSYVATN